MTTRYWLMKTEPGEFSLEDLKARPERTEHWDGVRNYQARNFMRDEMQKGDLVLFYHSGKNPEVVGTVRIARSGYPDHTAWDPDNAHYDPRSTSQSPMWYMVDVVFESEFERRIPLRELHGIAALADMGLLRRGNRLSVMPVTREEFDVIVELGRNR